MENLRMVLVDGELHPDSEVSEEIRVLRSLLPILPKEARIAIRLRFWESLTIQEIANALELSWDAADQLIENAVRELREGFKKLEKMKTLSAAS